MNLKILQINIKSLKSNFETLVKFMEDDSYDVVFLSEIWLKPNETKKFYNYKFYSSNRADGYGGVAVLVSNKIKSFLINDNRRASCNHVEYLEIRIETNQIIFNLVSVYIPPNKTNHDISNTLTFLFNKYNGKNKTIIGGDFNAHHTIWEERSKNDSRGRLLVEKIELTDLVIINNREHTYQNIANNTSSAVDITLVSPNLTDKIYWECVKTNIGSDHFPIKIQVGNYLHHELESMNYINYKKLAKLLETFNPTHTFDLIDFENAIVEMIQKVKIKKTREKIYSAKYWWNEEIERTWKIKQEKQKNL